MDKKLIQQLLDDDETRAQISIAFGLAVDADDDHLYDDLMINALNELNDTLVQGDMVTIEVSERIWVRGKYVRTLDDGRLVVDVPELTTLRSIHGRRVDLVVKGEEGEADV